MKARHNSVVNLIVRQTRLSRQTGHGQFAPAFTPFSEVRLATARPFAASKRRPRFRPLSPPSLAPDVWLVSDGCMPLAM